MCTFLNFKLWILVVLCTVDVSFSKLVEQTIYEELDGSTACFKRFNGTHEIGCGSNFGGNVGVVHLVSNPQDLEWVLNFGPHPPYMLAVFPEMFSQALLKNASTSGKVSGVVLLKTQDAVLSKGYSIDSKCPNAASSLYLNTSHADYCESHPWNPVGSGLLFDNWDFPIFLITKNESIEKVLSCYKSFNVPEKTGDVANWPLCSMELLAQMSGATNSEVCMRRKSTEFMFGANHFCDPLGNLNLWTSLFPMKQFENDSVIWVTTSADSSSLFDMISPGADAAVSGLVTLLASAEALFKVKSKISDSSKNVLFTIFEGEKWDYIGSSRMMYDIQQGSFPTYNNESERFDLSHLSGFIDITQMALGDSKIVMHTDPISLLNPDIKEKTTSLMEVFHKNSFGTTGKASFTPKKTGNPLPPSSFQSLLKLRNISGIVLADHTDGYHNTFYQTIYDDSENINFKYSNDSISTLSQTITAHASVIASSLYEMITGTRQEVPADNQFVDSLLYCYLQNNNCSYFRENSHELLLKYLKDEPSKTYVSVIASGNDLTHITRRILARVTGETTDLNQTDCHSNSTDANTLIYFPFIDNGTCIQSNVHESEAVSPAFQIDGYDWSSGKYSTWTESVFTEFEARVFLKASQMEDILTAFLGLACLFISMGSIWHINTKSSVIFDCE